MTFKVGNYIHAEPIEGEGETIQGTVLEIYQDVIVLDNSLRFNPELYKVTVFENVTNLLTVEQLARAEAMRRHPAGKGFRI
jgi:hypothetical protein